MDIKRIGERAHMRAAASTIRGMYCMVEESQANVPKFEAVCDWVFDRLCNAARNYDSPYGSAKATARMVERAAGDLALVFIEERERLKEVE